MNKKPKFPGHRVTTNGNQLVAAYTEALICDAGVFYPITPSTEMGENFQLQFAQGQLNAFGKSTVAIETEGEHAAQGGAIAFSVTGKRVVNFTSGQGIVYGVEQYYHAPGKLSTMVLEVGARALTKHALNVHCGHDDVYAALDTGWNITFAKDAQQASDQAIILRKVNELSLNPGMNCQDGFLTTHLERTFYKPDPQLIREYLGNAEDMIDCPTEAQKELFGAKRKRVPSVIDLKNPVILGLVENQEHYMNGVAARRNNFSEHILDFFEKAYDEFAELTGRNYGLISEYNCENAEVVFIALGSAAENIEAAVDYLKETRNETVGVIHINVIRPFPANAIINALRAKKKVIILERTDEPLSTDNPLTKEIRGVLNKAVQNNNYDSDESLEKLSDSEVPQIISGIYGLGSRDFRPEGIIGAYDFAMARIARKDGKYYGKGVSFIALGIDHPYAVISEETPSLLPDKSIAVRLHSIGGWGMITTGKNLGEIIGEFSTYIANRDKIVDEDGNPKEIVHVSANPKYGSEKKGAPTNYFMVAAPERIRTNCDLKHVNAVLCPDPKIFTHDNPLAGLVEGGAFVWESSETTSDGAWKRIPKKYRKEIIDKKLQLYILNGFDIAKNATEREELQLRMQGNAFLGAFFSISPFLHTFNIPKDEYEKTVRAQYVKKFGRFGDAVVESNMKVMQDGFNKVMKIEYGNVEDADTSLMRGNILDPLTIDKDSMLNDEKAPIFKMETFNREFKAGLGYHQPASVLSSVGLMPSGTGATASKYVARREVPMYIEENCTQCMECITVCPDTALPNIAQNISEVLITAIKNYVSDENERKILLDNVYEVEKAARAKMLEHLDAKDTNTRFREIVMDEFRKLKGLNGGITQLEAIFEIVPIAYQKVNAIFKSKEKKESGDGGLFSIFVNDLCKGCGACVVACGSHEALKMTPETEEVYAYHQSGINFLNLLKDTSPKYLGLYNPADPASSKNATLKNHLMQRSKYEALVSGDGSCAGCGEKSVLHSISTITESIMRPVFHAKADRFNEKATTLEKDGVSLLSKLKSSSAEKYDLLRQAVLHLIMGYGAENEEATASRISAEFKGSDKELIDALTLVLKQEAKNHKQWRSIEGRLDNGMSVMAMTANTGCNTVYGSTPGNNPHTYPWMNSLFQDGATIGWLVGESFIQDHSRRSVIPERLCDIVLDSSLDFDKDEYYKLTHFTDTNMTDDEVRELPKVWAIGGDGGMGDIGFQNVSKVVLQNRPNVKVLLLDTQVYSNTGGQNSDSSVMPGGFDMNQAGAATEGKLTEKKSVIESFMGGHGSPFLAQVSMANSATLYRSFIDGLLYRGTAFFQTYTSCQPEHGIADNMSVTQAQASRDSRGMPEMVYNPSLGETYAEVLSIKGNPSKNNDWHKKMAPVTKVKYDFTVAHWAFTEARFRLHHKIVKKDAVNGMVSLEKKMQLITMDDVTNRRFLDKNHRSFVPKNEIYTIDYDENGNEVYHILSRQMVLFCIERRKSWRMLQSRAGLENTDYQNQRELLKQIDGGELEISDFLKQD